MKKSKSISSSESRMTVERLLSILDSISDGVMTIDLDMRVTYFNRTAEMITGVIKDDAIGIKCNDVFNIHDNECALYQLLKTGKPVNNHFISSTDSNGHRAPINVSTALLRDNQGKIIGGVQTFRDLNHVEVLRKKLSSSYTFTDMIGRSQQMQEVFETLPKIAKSDSTVLIEGETGTGKELVAQAIHQYSHRRNKPMICVNSNAIPDSLCESELFGYKAGAFTDAKKDKKGRFTMAEGGTLFLDEIGHISPMLQVKLLRVLQDHVYEPLGSTKSVEADVRIIAATNRNLDKLMESGDFRQDLYYRLNVIRIKVPPLRERLEDVPLIIDHFISRFNHLKYKDISGISLAALNILMSYHFPGNVRELENIIEHAFALCAGGEIRTEHLPKYLQEKRPEPVVGITGSMKEMETLFFNTALKRNIWSRQDTARELGISLSTLYRKIKKLGLSPPPSGRTIR